MHTTTPAYTFNKTSTNICKGIAIILMYIHHSFFAQDYWGENTIICTPLSESQLIWIARVCKVCVSVFVFLSAYGVYCSDKIHPEKYISKVKRRYLTLLYNFFIVYFLTQFFSSLIGLSRTEVYGKSLLKRSFYTFIDALGLANAFSTPTYNATWWYMSFAFLLILLMPMMVCFTDKIGYAILPLSLLLPLLCSFNMDSPLFHYLFTICLGLVFAKYHIFEQLQTIMYKRIPFIILFSIINILGIAFCSYCRQRLGYTYLFDGINAVLICFFCYSVLQQVPIINQCLTFLGIHSMNMFMIHTLIRSKNVRLHAFSYSPRYPLLIILLLIMDTLIISIAIEYLKKILKRIILAKKQRLECHNTAD